MKTQFFLFFLTAFTAMQSFVFGEEDVGPTPDQGFWQTLVMLGIFIVFFYLLMWRPEQKKRKALEVQRNSLKKGDKVVAMGIIGTVIRLTDQQTVIVKMFDGAKIEFLKGAITDVIPETEENKKIEKAESEKQED